MYILGYGVVLTVRHRKTSNKSKMYTIVYATAYRTDTEGSVGGLLSLILFTTVWG